MCGLVSKLDIDISTNKRRGKLPPGVKCININSPELPEESDDILITLLEIRVYNELTVRSLPRLLSINAYS